MAEYYPLLARAIAGLPHSTPETRRAIYERARTALIGQLRAVQPPIAESDIQRESRMLDEAIARLEQEAGAASPPATPASAAPAPSTPPEARKPLDIPPRRFEAPMVRPSAPPLRPSLPPRPNLPPRPGAAPGERAPGMEALDAARQRLASLARPAPGAAPVAPPAPPVAQPPIAKPPQPESVAQREEPAPEAPKPATLIGPKEPPQVAQAPQAPQTPQAPSKPDSVKPVMSDEDLVAAAERRDSAPPVNITLRKYGPRAEAAGVSADLPPVEAGEEPRSNGVRPAAPQAPNEKERNLRPLLIGVPVALVVGAIAVFAYVRRDNPEDLARLRPAPGAEAPAEQGTGKIVERIGGGGQTARPADQKPAQPPAQPQPAQPTQSAQPNTPAIPVSQRAALLVDAPDDPQRVRTYVGNVVWRLDNVSRGPGQPLAIGVRAELDMPEAKLKAVILIQKNTDETLPASHTIEVRFMPAEDGPIPGVAQISTPQMRKEDTPAGDALSGVPAPILRNYFLVGLARDPSALSRNIDLLRNRGWIDIPLLLSDQRIAKITIEKGTAGERVINEALEAWK